MKIKQLHIYGFGKWQDQKWDLSKQQMTVIIGDNEAGKTTIRAFILFMLFGLPPQQRQRYRPKRGGQLGGQLVVQASNGKDYTIERFDDRFNGEAICYDQAGQKQAANWLTKELNGIDRLRYNQIFNFDVLSLQIDGGVSKEQLGEVLLSVGMTGSDRIYQAEKHLQKSLDLQFKKQGSKPELNQMITALVETDQELKQLEDSVDAYQAHQQKSQAYQAEIAIYRTEINELNQQWALLSEQARIYPAIENYHLLTRRLADFPKTIDFPEQGEARFKQAKANLQPLQADVEVAKRQIAVLEADLVQLNERLLPEQLNKQLSVHLEQAEMYQRHLNEKNQLERQIVDKNALIMRQLNDLNLKLTETNLLELPLNYTTKQIWRSVADDNHEQTQQLMAHKQTLQQLTVAQAQLDADLAIQEKKVLTEREKTSTEQALAQMNQSLEMKDQEKNEPLLKLHASHRLFSLISVSVMLISLLVIMATEHRLISGGLLAVILIVAFVFIRQQLKFSKQWLTLFNEQKNEETTEWADRRDQLNEKLTLHENHRDQVLLLREQLKQNQAEHLHVTNQLNTVSSALASTEHAIDQERERYPFLTQLSVAFWPELAERLLATLELITQRDELLKQCQQERVKLEQFERKTTAQFNDLLNKQEKQFQQQLAELKDRLVQQKAYLEQQENREQRLTDQRKIHEQLEAKMIPYQRELDQLLTRANVDSEEAFISQAHRYQEWSELKGKQQEMLRQIQLHLPEAITRDILSGDFLTENELELKMTAITTQIAELEQTVTDLMQKEADQQAMLKQLAHSKATVNLKHAFHLKKEKLAEAAKQWLVNQLALKQIEQTKVRFQTSYLPLVLEKASQFFAKLTEQRYTKIDFEQNSHHLFILTRDHYPYQLEELSQGTLDQLFVSIRLAVSSWLAEQVQLPFLIDDGFVHFDAGRKQELDQLLAQLSEVHQIIYFTKDQTVFEQTSQSSPAVRFLNLL